MSDFGFPTATPPDGAALADSWAVDDVERELNELFRHLLELVGSDAFDATNLGAMHLGSTALVRRAVTHDGLMVLPGEQESDGMRYLYRAWQARDRDGRGIHFLRTYLQLLQPLGAKVAQLWHDKDLPYGNGFVWLELGDRYYHYLNEPGLSLDGSWFVGQRVEPDEVTPINPFMCSQASSTQCGRYFLTSHLAILLHQGAATANGFALDSTTAAEIDRLRNILRAVLPARLTPLLQFQIFATFVLSIRLLWSLRLFKSVAFDWPLTPGERLQSGGVKVRMRGDFSALWPIAIDGRRDVDGSWVVGGFERLPGLWWSAVLRSAGKLAHAAYVSLSSSRKVDGTWRLGTYTISASSPVRFRAAGRSIAADGSVSALF